MSVPMMSEDVHGRLTRLVDENFGYRATMPVEALLDILEQEVPRLKQLAEPVAWWSGEDQPLPEDAEIRDAFPTRSGRHDLYATAMRLVGARFSKAGLVALVHWLLCKASPQHSNNGKDQGQK